MLDPIWNLSFPKERPGQYYWLLELRHDPSILWRRLEMVTRTATLTAHVHRYNRKEDVYDRASTFNWETKGLTGALGWVL